MKLKYLSLFYLFLSVLNLSAQQTIWVKQMAGKDSKISPLGLFSLDEDKIILIYKADKNFLIGRREIKIEDSSAIHGLIFNSNGEFELADSIGELYLKKMPSTSGNQWILKSEQRNGNYFLAYGLNSPIRLPVGLSWNLAYLDGLGHRLWEKHLGENQQIAQLQLLQNGKCLLVGSEIAANGNKDIWISIWDEYGHEIWKKTIGGKSDDIALSSTYDLEGNIYVSGFFSADSSFLGNTRDLSGKEKDGFIACFKKDGAERFFYRQRGEGYNTVSYIAGQALGKLFFASTVAGKDWRLAPFGFPKIGVQDVVVGLIDPKQEKPNNNPLRVFPNPTREVVYFGLENKIFKGKAFAILHQKDGPAIQEMKISGDPGSSFRFNVSNTKPGAYFITLKDKNKSLSTKVVIE